jgi:hypothetical protein
MKEQLVEMTGLSPRVIRVWFQNKRCKDKKKAILMKQQLQQEKVCLNKVLRHLLETKCRKDIWRLYERYGLSATVDHSVGCRVSYSL